MPYPELQLTSHKLCPIVQRAAIALLENDVPFERRYIDLVHEPDWFLEISPLGKVPLLVVDHEHILFESSPIAQYIDDTMAARDIRIVIKESVAYDPAELLQSAESMIGPTGPDDHADWELEIRPLRGE